ncbi:hypothetical protein GO491_05280 [Flavobacteriaceae bacterium Ap0902]|nr:hypothetical protein [Flavobacteriaceae bacterium Ap0902]
MYLLVFTTFLLFSCESDDILNEKNSNDDILIEGISIKDNKLSFPSEDAFNVYYNNLKSMKNEKVADEMYEKFYRNGFFSAIPIVNDKTISVLESHQIHHKNFKFNHKRENKSYLKNNININDDYDDIEDLLGDDVFISFLDQNGELIVNNILYKYTDVGIFKIEYENSQKLNNFLISNNLSTNLFEKSSEENIKRFILNNNPCGGMTEIWDKDYNISFEYFIREIKNCNLKINNTTPNNIVKNNNFDLGDIASNLTLCEGRKPWFGNLLGVVRVCIDKYDSKHRVKTKYYDIDLLLAYAMGVKVKHQKKGWTGLWRKQTTSYVALGLNSLTYKFNLNSSAQAVDNMGNVANARFYLYNNNLYETTQGYYNASHIGITPMPDLPFANNFFDDIAFVIEVGRFNVKMDYTEEDLTNFFYNTLYNQVDSVLGGLNNLNNKNKGVVIFKGENATAVQIYDFSNICQNCDKREVVIDWGFSSPEFTYRFGVGSKHGWSITSWNYNFRNPNIVALSAYGMAQKNGI